jgi:hypothetical protein
VGSRRRGKQDEALAAQQEIADRHWQVARTLAHDLMEGEFRGTGKVWGVVLEDGEQFISDVQADYARYHGTDVGYTHLNGLFLGSVPFTALGYGFTAIGNASRRATAEAVARTRWREYQPVRLIITDRRLLCQVVGGRWLSFHYRGAAAIYPEPAVWSLVIDFPDSAPIRVGGMGSPIASVAAVWAVYGPDGLRDHPGLAPLRD